MLNAITRPPSPANEPVLSYAPGSPERALLKRTLEQTSQETQDFPLFIGGKEVRTGDVGEARCPHAHRKVLGRFHRAGPAEVESAIGAAREARQSWAEASWHQRAAVFLRAAELLAGKYRQTLNAATMLGQSKTSHQAEIDAACELVDFWRFNVSFMARILSEQPESAPGTWNILDARPLEGFVFAVTPFNFTSIGGNLPTAPALMGNTVIWKPASTAVPAAHVIMQILREAGLPAGVINLLYGSGSAIGAPVLASPDFAGLHFTGSTGVFNAMWSTIAGHLNQYRAYPRIVGETGERTSFLPTGPRISTHSLSRSFAVVSSIRGRSAPLRAESMFPTRSGQICASESSRSSKMFGLAMSPTSAISWARSSTRARTPIT